MTRIKLQYHLFVSRDQERRHNFSDPDRIKVLDEWLPRYASGYHWHSRSGKIENGLKCYVFPFVCRGTGESGEKTEKKREYGGGSHRSNVLTTDL